MRSGVREAFKDVPLVIGGIEASLRRIAHFDYWSEKIRRSVLLDAKADMLVYGNGERQICEIAHRLAAGEDISADHRHPRHRIHAQAPAGRLGGDQFRRTWMRPVRLNPPIDPYAMEPARGAGAARPLIRQPPPAPRASRWCASCGA